MSFHEISAEGIRVALDPSVGHIATFEVVREGRAIEPLHRAPWVDAEGETFPDETLPNVRRLSGDFLCAPFGLNDMEAAPGHGWPANSEWRLVESGATATGAAALFELQRPVFGARVTKRFELRHGEPFLYQEHAFEGGEGAISAAHHVMVRMAEGGRIAVSPKLFAETPPEALEPDPARGRSILAYPATVEGFGAFPLAAGGTADLRSYPPGDAHEDFLTLAEDPANRVGWTVVSRFAERDHVIVLKDPRDLPVTLMWMSNGGRDYAPWSSRHVGVLGIEDARASPGGHRDSVRDNDFTRRGIATAFRLDPAGRVTFRQVLGASPAAVDRPVESLSVGVGAIVLAYEGGGEVRLPWNPAFLGV
jgi:Uncharacterized enzymes related to aldose 1-epimerase